MRRLFLIFRSVIAGVVLVASVASCAKLGELGSRIDSLENRMDALQKALDALNGNISALQALVNAGTINSVKLEGNVYTITLSNGQTIVLDQGSIGVGNAPVLAIDSDGYWMVDYGQGFEYILVGGQKVMARGVDGVTPVFGVDADGYWIVSYDGGESFTQVLDPSGNPVKATPEGQISDRFFTDASYDAASGIFTVTLRDGTVLRIPVVQDFLCYIQAEGEQSFDYGQTRVFDVVSKGVAQYMITAPDGWQASLEADKLSVTAPEQTTKTVLADTRTDVNILAVSLGGYAAIAKLKVVISDTPGPGPGPEPVNYFDLWEAGEEITIAGATYSKAVYGEAVHVTEAAVIAASGVYFVEPDVECSVNYSGSFQKLIIVGASSAKRSVVKAASQIKFNQGAGTTGHFVCMNIDLDATQLGNNIFVLNSDAAFGLVAMDGCVIRPSAGKNFAYMSSSARSIAELAFVGCDYVVGANNSPVLNLGGSTATYASIRMENTIFYAKEGSFSGFRLFQGPSASIGKVELRRCTMVNLLCDTGFLVNCQSGAISRADLHDNLFYLSVAQTSHMGVLRAATWPTTGEVLHNAVFKQADGFNFQSHFGGIKNAVAGSEEITLLSENPFSEFNQATCTFKQKAAYKDYGAVR